MFDHRVQAQTHPGAGQIRLETLAPEILTSYDFRMKGGLSGISGAMERLFEKKGCLGLRKTFVVVTIVVLIGLLACSGPAPTPESLGTRPLEKSDAMLEETATEASGQITTETPARIDAAMAPTTIAPVPQGHHSAYCGDIDAGANDIGAQSDELGGYGHHNSSDKPNYVGPYHGRSDFNPGADSRDNTGLYERAGTLYDHVNHIRGPHLFRDTGIQQVPLKALGRRGRGLPGRQAGGPDCRKPGRSDL